MQSTDTTGTHYSLLHVSERLGTLACMQKDLDHSLASLLSPGFDQVHQRELYINWRGHMAS
jgi:hypothetical protein